MNYATLAAQIQSYVQNYEPDFVTNIPVFVKQAEARIYNTVQIPALRKNVTGSLTANNKYLNCPEDYLSSFSLAIYSYSTHTASGAVDTATIVVSNNVGIIVGQAVSGTGIAAGAKVVNINGNTITLSIANTNAVSGTITFQSDYSYLLNKDVNFIREAYPYAQDVGQPKYYAIFGPTVAGSVISNELSFILGPTPDINYGAELHYYYYPQSIVQGEVTGFSLTAGGLGYVDGVYSNVSLTGGSGSGAVATIVVTNGAVSEVQIVSGGSFFLVGQQLSAATEDIGGGSGFYFTVTSISNSTGTSWLGDNYDPVLLYGSLVEAYIFMKGEQDMMAYYEKKFQDAISQLNRLGTGLERGDAYRDGQAKIKVNP